MTMKVFLSIFYLFREQNKQHSFKIIDAENLFENKKAFKI
jgi:hypothetical protein